METNVGRMTLQEFRAQFGIIRYTATTDQFRQLAAVAAAQDLPLINGGYTYDAELIARLRLLDPAIVIERLESTDLATRFQALDLDEELALQPFVRAAQRALDRLGCEVVMRVVRAGQSVVALSGRPRGGVPGRAASHQGSRRPGLGRRARGPRLAGPRRATAAGP